MNITELKKRYEYEYKTLCLFNGGTIPEISDYVSALEDATRWRDVREELPTAIDTDNIWEKGMSKDVLILMGDITLIARYHTTIEKWIIPMFVGDWKPEYWQPLPAWPEGK